MGCDLLQSAKELKTLNELQMVIWLITKILRV